MQKDVEKKKGTLDRWMDFIERVGNALPDPVSLFIILAVIVVVLSAIFGSMGMSAVHPGTGKTITVVNLLTKDGFRQMYSKAVNNFASFAPLGMVLVCCRKERLFGCAHAARYAWRKILGCYLCDFVCWYQC